MQAANIAISSERACASSKAPHSPFSAMIGLARLFLRKMAERRNRNALLELSDDQLKDIGLSRGQSGSDVHVYSRY
jgi:uncharacterized protein YjiS (DUF1127 family)